MSGVDVTGLARRLIAAAPGRRDDAIAVLNGAIGDRLLAAESPLAIEMSLLPGADRAHADRPPPGARPRVCVLVHGLMGSERAWWFGTKAGQRVEYGSRLAEARDVTPVYARYNTGLHVSSNGRELAERLEGLLSQWPAIRELSIVGHSMGGLVARSAIHYGSEAGHAWVSQLGRVFLLGVPSHGATWEQLAHVTAFTLDTIWNPWTKIIGKAINMRSAGIKDLRHGFVLDEDWRDRDPDKLRLAVPRRTVFPSEVPLYVAAGSVGDEQSTLSRLLGDGLVPPSSAHGEGFGSPRGVLPATESRVFGHTAHNALMTDPAVLQQLLDWWS
jgi:pimeloyl-ACP methyl ester carboxylesterase